MCTFALANLKFLHRAAGPMRWLLLTSGWQLRVRLFTRQHINPINLYLRSHRSPTSFNLMCVAQGFLQCQKLLLDTILDINSSECSNSLYSVLDCIPPEIPAEAHQLSLGRGVNR
ncbi:hypothetical protein SCP_0509740 [Sparassis crispa]|uniref:Uncharacterized protein n=1 Tax=Sparassis crispa TaxID=139825 RepID=A0A401GNW5_9APHY|nr:hypothetical protein SCP_0509740 [Sparassis crispa]GBE83915.1 hypothetical protein SCP_0509740 [Sparassis crispa]